MADTGTTGTEQVGHGDESRTDTAGEAAPTLGIRFENRMSDSDALMWNIEKDPMLRSTITSIVFLDGHVDRDRLERRVERISRVIPRLRQRVRSNPLSIAPPRWEVDPNFNLKYHLRSAKAPGLGTRTDVLRMAEPLAMQGFDRARPLWEFVLVEGLADRGSALIMKVHHSITDGVGGVQLMLELFDLERDAPDRELPDPPEVHVMTQAERFVDAFNHERRRGVEFLRRATGAGIASLGSALADPSTTVENTTEMVESVARVVRPVTTPYSPLMTDRSISTHFEILTIPMDAAKRAARSVGGKLNDAFVGGVTLGLRHYHHRHGIDCPSLRMGMPISVRSEENGDVSGNAFLPARLDVAIDTEDPAESMRRVHDLVIGAKGEPANQLVEPLSNIINRLPTTLVTAFFGTMMKGVDFITSNVPGAPFPLYLAGAEVSSQFPFGPLAGAATNITLLSYQQDLNIGVNLDPAAIPDQAVFIECLRQGMDEVLALG